MLAALSPEPFVCVRKRERERKRESHAGSCIVARTLQDVLRAVRERASFVAQCGVKRAALASNKSLKCDNIQISRFEDVCLEPQTSSQSA